MHINLEMLECVYLVSAMLLEIPYMAAHEFDARRRMISKSYYQQLRSSERQALVGPPESMREHIVAASRAMRNGDWKKCRDMIVNEKMNAKVNQRVIIELTFPSNDENCPAVLIFTLLAEPEKAEPTVSAWTMKLN